MLFSARAMCTLENVERCLQKLKESNNNEDISALQKNAIELESEAYRLLTEVNSLHLLRRMHEIKKKREA